MGSHCRNFSTMLAPQMRILFGNLLGNDNPIAFNCSAGQNRSGFANALILSALDVRRDVVFAGYRLSPIYPRPEYDMPKIDGLAQASNPVAMFFARYPKHPKAVVLQSL
jgi:protein-tyrosine phosphatase